MCILQEKCLRRGQAPVAIDKLSSGDIRAGDAQRDDLACNQGPNKALRPDTCKAPPET